VETRQETHCLSHEEKVKSIEDYVDRETAVARKGDQDAETAIKEEQEHMTTVEMARSTTTKHEPTFERKLNAMADSLSNLSSSKDEEVGEDEDHDEEELKLGTRSEDDEPGWVMGTISKTVEHRMESVRQRRMMLDKLTQPR